MLLKPGTRIGRFVITDRIGAGGMGEVYRARDSRLGRDVAIKTLGASLVHDPDIVARFEREAMAASALNHPNIVTIYDIGQDEVDGRNLNYLAMELIEGETLTARIGRPNETGATLDVLTDVAEALSRAHAAGIVTEICISSRHRGLATLMATGPHGRRRQQRLTTSTSSTRT